MIAFWIALAVVAIISLVVTICNIADGLREVKKEMERGISLEMENTEYDYGHNVKYTSEEEL